jgi:tripartite-type tricarboxylate transporter receptor subunit TctC
MSLLKCFNAVASLAFALAATATYGQAWPSKPVHLIVPQTPGGATDVFARAVGQKLAERWGQPVVVENKGGAAGVIGTDYVAKAPPDGYTLLVTYEGSQAINQTLYAKLPFDSVADFSPVATLAVTPFFLIVGPKMTATSTKEYLAAAKAQPGKISYSSSGSGSINHLLGEVLKTETGVNILHVPYKGITAAISDVVGGQVDSGFASVPSVIQLVQANKVRALAVTSPKRNASAPQVPTFIESGCPGLEVNPWWGVLGPANLPAQVTAKINADVATVLATTEIQEVFRKQGASAYVQSADAFLAQLKNDVQKWAKVVKSSGARVD